MTSQGSVLEQEIPALSSIKPASKVPLSADQVLEFEQIFSVTSVISKQQPSPEITWVLDQVGYIDNVLSNEECQNICKYIDLAKSLSFWSELGRDNEDAKSFRDADTVELNSTNTTATIWDRIADLFSSLQIIFGKEDDGRDCWHMDLPGTWQAISLNNDLLLARYPTGGYFSPHTDGNAIHTFNCRSFYSVILFLNSIPVGGGTKFYSDESVNQLKQSQKGAAWEADPSLCIGEVAAVAGRFLFFDQRYVHEGVPTNAPSGKYIVRSDIMFLRSPALLTTPQDERAYSLHREAETLSEAGKTEEAIKLFRLAFKMSPALAKIMGQP